MRLRQKIQEVLRPGGVGGEAAVIGSLVNSHWQLVTMLQIVQTPAPEGRQQRDQDDRSNAHPVAAMSHSWGVWFSPVF
jgi:hypothetical protein